MIGCARCGTAYEARLVRWACPVCALPAPGEHHGSRLARATEDDRTLLIVGVATIGNVLLLAVLAVAVLRVT